MLMLMVMIHRNPVMISLHRADDMISHRGSSGSNIIPPRGKE